MHENTNRGNVNNGRSGRNNVTTYTAMAGIVMTVSAIGTATLQAIINTMAQNQPADAVTPNKASPRLNILDPVATQQLMAGMTTPLCSSRN